MIRRGRLACLAALALAGVPGCGRTSDESPASPRKVRVSFTRHLSWGPLMIADAEGFFADENLDVEFVPLMRPEESLVALVTGDIDVRPGPLSAGMLSAIARGATVRIVAGMGNLEAGSCTYYGIVLRPGLDTAGTPRIRRMRASQDGATRFIAEHMLSQRNMTFGGIETVRVPEAVMAMALESGSLDAVAWSEPALTRLKKVGTLWLSGQDAVPGFQWAVVVFGDRLLNRERDTGMRFIRAYQRGVAQYRQGKTERNVEIIARATEETPEHTREVCWPDFRPDSRINWESIAAFQRWANGEGFMNRTLTLEQAFDSSFMAADALAASSRSP